MHNLATELDGILDAWYPSMQGKGCLRRRLRSVQMFTSAHCFGQVEMPSLTLYLELTILPGELGRSAPGGATCACCSVTHVSQRNVLYEQRSAATDG